MLEAKVQRQRLVGPALLGLEVQEGPTSQGVQAASGSWKRQGQGFPPRPDPPRERSPPTHGPRKPISDPNLQN